MQRRTFVAGLATLPIAMAGCSSNKATEPVSAMIPNNLMSTLSPLGVTEKQAGGGIGSMLTLAQQKLAAGDFDKITAVVPQAGKYLDMAKSLGAVTGPISNMSDLTSALGRLGMNSATASKFVPAVSSYLSKVGGSEVGSLLTSVLK